MAGPNGNGNEKKRKPFRNDEKITAWKLCAKSAIRIDELTAQLKEERDRFEKLKDSIRAGGYLVDDQGHLPLESGEEDDAEARA